uniref:Ig-like domain-containing protein n=1 Tax=Heterorhabditis bacteriophora TaxID=37862 RepID=A0A1I7X713_HETBA
MADEEAYSDYFLDYKGSGIFHAFFVLSFMIVASRLKCSNRHPAVALLPFEPVESHDIEEDHLWLYGVIKINLFLSFVMEEVVLMEQPQSGHVVKSRPYHLSCKAINARKIRFKCNNKWECGSNLYHRASSAYYEDFMCFMAAGREWLGMLDESRYESILGTDVVSQLPYLESSVEISRQEVETSVHLEDLSCQCYASGTSDSHVIRSDSARIRVACYAMVDFICRNRLDVAGPKDPPGIQDIHSTLFEHVTIDDMRKHFVQSPTSERVPEGSTVQLQCVAPESDPKAQLTWLKDGAQLEKLADSNVIYANDGSLIISAARLGDSGNYSCEASNIANRRSTDPAWLNVYGQSIAWDSDNLYFQVTCFYLPSSVSTYDV